MSAAHKSLDRSEKMEKTAHQAREAEHGLRWRLQFIGLSIGLIGVLIALCTSQAGAERDRATRALIEQTQANAEATNAATKFRIVMIDIEQLRGRSNIAPELSERLAELYHDYHHEREVADSLAGSYRPLIELRYQAIAGYEFAQLLAEIGVVCASLSILLSVPLPWYLALVLAVGSAGQYGFTAFRAASQEDAVMAKIRYHRQIYDELLRLHLEDNSDAQAIRFLDPDGALLHRVEESRKMTPP